MSTSSGHGVAALSATPAGIGLWPRVRSERVFVGLFAALVGLAWLGLIVWRVSPYARFLSHEEVGEVAPMSREYLELLAFFVVGWTLMTAAMMLPTSLPLFAFFRSLVRQRSNRATLVAAVVSGYVAVWTAFAVAVHAGDQVVHSAVGHSAWLDRNAWLITASTVAFAGLYQFSTVKYRCLDKCRSPVGFVMAHWREGRHRNALTLGVRHGLFCLGCCWSLMLLMFAVGIGNIAWMLLLAAVMATEKNVSWGRRLTAPLGVALLLGATAIVVVGMAGIAA